MKKYLITVFTLLSLQLGANAQKITGDWAGELQLGTQKLNIVFHFSTDSLGAESCTMDVPKQGAKGIPVVIQHNAGDSVSLSMTPIMAKYSGKKQGEKIVGIFAQAGYTFPLDLGQMSSHTSSNRPQSPVAPFPYSTKEVSFTNAVDSAVLAGTLTLPVGFTEGDRVPVVLLVSGSGPQNRDEELFEHKPFAVIAHHLAHHGIASLRYDDRGVGKSTGEFKGKTTVDFAEDASAGLKYLKGQKGFSQVGLIGHSEGGAIAFILGAKGEPDFIITLAAPGIKGDTLVTEQSNRQLELTGLPTRITTQMARQQFLSMGDAWMNYFLDYNPASDIRATKVPTFALNGTLDSQVLEPSNLGSIRNLLPQNPKNLIKSYEGLNHIFQHATTGAALEYYDIEETISTEVLDDIVKWIKAL